MKDPSRGKPEPIKKNSLSKQKIKDLERSEKEHKQPEEAPRESEGKLNAMLRSIPDHISVIDRELNIVWANVVATGMFGNDIIGRKCYEVYHRRKEPCEPNPCIVLKAFEDGGIHEHDTEVVDKEGKIIYFHCTANVASRDKDNKPVTVLEISRDITEGKQAEEALRESENRLRRLAENAPDLIYRMSLPDGKYEYVSPASYDMTGFTPEEHYNGTIDIKKAIHPDFAEYLDRQWKDLLRGEMPPFYEYKIIHRNGGERWLYQRNVLIRDESGSPVAIEGIVTDITDRKRMEEELKAHRDHLGELVAERTGQIRQEIARRKEKEKELSVKSKALEEVNAALRVLLKQREEDRQELEGKFVSNVREMVLPYIQIIKKGQWLDPKHRAYLDIAETNLREIISPFLNTVRQLNFTPKEIEVSSLIKEGRTTKEIAELMSVAPSAVDSHRNNIRIKLGLNNKKANLRSYLLSLK